MGAKICYIRYFFNLSEEKCNHELISIKEIIPNKKILSKNNAIFIDVKRKIKFFKYLINNWKKQLEKKVNEFLLSIDKMEMLYKSFGEPYQIENFYEYKSFLNYNNINIIRDKWTSLIDYWNKNYKNNFYDFNNMSNAVLELINNMESLKINYYINNIKNRQK